MAANFEYVDVTDPRDTDAVRGQFTAEVDRITEPEWSRLLDEFEDASIYQTWAYGAISWGEKHLSHLVLRLGGVPVAMAQSRVIRVPVIGSGIAYVRWGPVCVRKGSQYEPSIWRAAMDALVREYVKRRGLALRIIPFAFEQDAAATAVSTILSEVGYVQAPGTRRYRTLLVDLEQPLERMRAALARNWRNHLNAAERNELQIAEGTDSGLYAEFAGIYREMMARKQFETTVSVAAFSQIQDRLPESQKMLTVIGRRNGRPSAGVVASTIGTTAIYLLGATGDEGRKSQAAYLLQWRLLRRLQQLGCKRYDLGGINAEANPGVYSFKKGLGGREVAQIGVYDLRRNRLSGLALAVGERMNAVVGRLRAAQRRGSAGDNGLR